jgi:DNA-binding SARP family transcriptional activator/tetratricopeptide (TPR) repeat protein
VEFGLLGNLEVRSDGVGIDVGHARQSCVLVTLLVEANRPVSVEALLDRVWGDRPPQRAREALHSYVSRLRRALTGAGTGSTDAVAITRVSGGYRITVDPMAVDLHRFTALLARARVAASPDEAVTLLRSALGLWRGPAFGTLETPWLAGLRASLETNRLSAELDRNDILLGRGEYAGLAGELGVRAQAHPLDERLMGQLMLALYREGRQADALAAYHDIRVRLADELGADPSPSLSKIHRQILSADPAAGGVSAAIPVPRQLPAPPLTFAGRRHELDELSRALDGGPAGGRDGGTVVISAIGGAGGIGKTWLAVRWAHEHADRFPDGQLYVDLRGFHPTVEPAPPTDALRGFLEALGVARPAMPTDVDALAALYRSLVADRRILIVLDNARDTAQVTPLLPGTPGGAVLVTSRNKLAGLVATHGARSVALDVLTEAESRVLLTHHCGPERLAAEAEPVATLLRVCGGLPLALGITAARAATHPDLPLAALADELREASLDALDAGEMAVNLRAVLACSYRALPAPAAAMFRRLGAHPGPDLGLPAAASLAGAPATTVRVRLRELANAHLVAEHRPGRYRMHDLVRLFAAEAAGEAGTGEGSAGAAGAGEGSAGGGDGPAALRRAVDHYLHTAHAAASHLDPYWDPIPLPPAGPGVVPEPIGDHDRALAWYVAEHAVLVAAVARAFEAGLDAQCWRLAQALVPFFDLRGLWPDLAATLTAALAAARRLGDRHGQAFAHRGLGRANARLGLDDDAHAHYRAALALFDQQRDDRGHARARIMLSWLLHRQGDDRAAMAEAMRALELYGESGPAVGRASALGNIGWYLAQLGAYGEAQEHCERARALHRDAGNRYGEASTLDSLGYIHHRLGHHTPAIDAYRDALRLFHGVGSRHGEANTLVHLGDVHRDNGDGEAAGRSWRRALVILDELGHPDGDPVRTRLAGLAGPAGPLDDG